ncbi:MAG: aminopeptidase [Rhodanobacteraceae bacterium]
MTHGQVALLVHRTPVARVVADPSIDAKVRERLVETQEARRFASDALGLPRNGSYTSYVDLGRPYVTWNVFATPEFSVDPVTHCFPFAGCVAYVGFFDRATAEREAEASRAAGDDVAVEGTSAYSTLGWFSDPILSSMMRWSDDELDGVIFHELAHQLVYVGDDSAFNESFATFVQQEGLREWRASRSRPLPDPEEVVRDAEFSALVLDLRDRLRAVYASGKPVDAMRAAKVREIEAFRERYRQLRDAGWGGNTSYDGWVEKPINNARLVPFGLYDRWVPAFARLFDHADRSWPRFYGYVRSFARLPSGDRARLLDLWLPESQAARQTR